MMASGRNIVLNWNKKKILFVQFKMGENMQDLCIYLHFNQLFYRLFGWHTYIL